MKEAKKDRKKIEKKNNVEGRETDEQSKRKKRRKNNGIKETDYISSFYSLSVLDCQVSVLRYMFVDEHLLMFVGCYYSIALNGCALRL